MINGHVTYSMTKKSENTLNKKGIPLDIRPKICYNMCIMMSHVMLTLKRTNNLLIMENIICVSDAELVDLSELFSLPSVERTLKVATLKFTINNLIMKENILCVYAVEIVDLSVLSCLPKTEKKFVNWGNKCHFPLTLTSGICYN